MVDVGDSIPDFKLPDADNNLKTLPVGQKLVLVFYPAAFTGVCQAELCNFRDNLSKFSDRNAKVIAISVDYPFSVKEFQFLLSMNKELLDINGLQIILVKNQIMTKLILN